MTNTSENILDIVVIADTDIVEKKIIMEKHCNYHNYKSCKEIQLSSCNKGDGSYLIDPDDSGPQAPFPVFCDMSTNNGGWTLALRADGHKNTFEYNAIIWENNSTLNPLKTYNPNLEHKNPSFSKLNFTQIMLVMNTDGTRRNIVINKTANSLEELFSGPDNQTFSPLGRDAWTNLVPNASLQQNCNLEAINNPLRGKIRIGIASNQENDCISPDSLIGIGYRPNFTVCSGFISTSTVGNYNGCLPDRKEIVSWGEIYIR